MAQVETLDVLEAQDVQEFSVNLLQSAVAVERQGIVAKAQKPKKRARLPLSEGIAKDFFAGKPEHRSEESLVSLDPSGEAEELEVGRPDSEGLEDWSFARIQELHADGGDQPLQPRRHKRKHHKTSQELAERQWPGAESPHQEHPGLATLYTDSQDSDFLAMDITDLVNSPETEQVVVSAMAARGTHHDSYGQMVTLHEPLENTDNTILGFRRSLDNNSILVLQPQMGLRTSDAETELAFSMGASRPLTAMLRPMPRLRGPFASRATPDRVIIDGFDLIVNGFFVSGSATGRARLIRAAAYPTNIVVTALFSIGSGQPLIVTFSMMALPRVPMAPRPADPRLGYFTTDYVDLGVHEPGQHETASEAVDRRISMIWRYDLPALPDRQLKVYVDPSVPHRFRQAFKEGIEAWNVAFEPIGFPNALRAVLPTDSDWPEDYDPGDGRFTSVAWCVDRSMTYAMGIAKVDPRTGEILHGAVIFGDGWVQSYLRDLERLAPTMHLPSGYRREEFTAAPTGGWPGLEDHETLGGLPVLLQNRLNETSTTQMDIIQDALRDVMTHEMGHLLGLRHNFKGSAGVSWECTQDRACSAEHGLTTSVMDYLPMNVPSRRNADVHLFTPIVGAYDRLAILYGYIEPPAGTTEDSSENSAQLSRALEEAEDIPTCTDGNLQRDDPLCAQHDLGGDPIMFFEDQLVLVADSLHEAFDNAVLPGNTYGKFGDAVLGLMSKTRSVAGGLSKFIGGVNVTFAHRRSDGSHRPEAKRAVDGEQQRRAFQLLLRLLRPHHHGLLPHPWTESFLVETQGDGVRALDLRPEVIRLQNSVLGTLLDGARVAKVCTQPHGPSGFNCSELIGGVLHEALGVSGPAANVTDSQDWDMQKALAQHLRVLHADESLPEVVAAEVAEQVHNTEMAIARALQEIPSDQRHTERAHLLLLQRKMQEGDSCNDVAGWSDSDGDGCDAYGANGWCGASWQGSYSSGGHTGDTACCVCGGGQQSSGSRTSLFENHRSAGSRPTFGAVLVFIALSRW